MFRFYGSHDFAHVRNTGWKSTWSSCPKHDTSPLSLFYGLFAQHVTCFWLLSGYNRISNNLCISLSNVFSYLTGNQLMSESSIEAYISVLKNGCRCIEREWNLTLLRVLCIWIFADHSKSDSGPMGWTWRRARYLPWKYADGNGARQRCAEWCHKTICI